MTSNMDLGIPISPSRPDIRLIPTTLWGISLAGLCTGSCWEAIRAEALRSGARCIHADNPDRRTHHFGSIHLHERWRYKEGAASLEALWPVCGNCHDMMHPGRMLAVHGQVGLQRAVVRYARVFGIKEEMAWKEAQRALAEHTSNSRVDRWTVDLSLVEPRFPLKPKKSARAVLACHEWVGHPFGAAHDLSKSITG
jgi:hypothetical protein